MAFWRFGRMAPTGRDVVMYTRQGCHLCADAWQVLQQARQRFDFSLREVDVDSDPTLAEQHGLSVPVVAIDGKVHFRGHVNPVLLTRVLRGGS